MSDEEQPRFKISATSINNDGEMVEAFAYKDTIEEAAAAIVAQKEALTASSGRLRLIVDGSTVALDIRDHEAFCGLLGLPIDPPPPSDAEMAVDLEAARLSMAAAQAEAAKAAAEAAALKDVLDAEKAKSAKLTARATEAEAAFTEAAEKLAKSQADLVAAEALVADLKTQVDPETADSLNNALLAAQAEIKALREKLPDTTE